MAKKKKSNGSSVNDGFTSVARVVSSVTGSPWAFITALLVIIIWLVTGPYFRYSDTWQLIVNTGTTIVTFLMVFLIQNAQNRDSVAIQLKLDEILNQCSTEQAKDFMKVEELTEEEVEALKKKINNLKKKK